MNTTMLLEKTKHHPVMLDQILSIISPQHGGIRLLIAPSEAEDIQKEY